MRHINQKRMKPEKLQKEYDNSASFCRVGTYLYIETMLCRILRKGGKKSVRKVLVNFTNHPYEKWGEKQKEDAKRYGEVIDVPFPHIAASSTKKDIIEISERCMDAIVRFSPEAVVCQGEFCLAYRVTKLLQERGIKVLAACSDRIVKEEGDKKQSIFQFEQFREY